MSRAYDREVIAPALLLDRDHLMLLMPILPMMLIGMILLANALDSRGWLGPPLREVSLRVPLSAIAAGLALAAAAVHGSDAIGTSIGQSGGSVLILAVVCFQVGWSIAHMRLRSAFTATAGMVGTGVILAGWLVGRIFLPGADAATTTLSDLFGVTFEVALLLALVPQVAPTLAARLSERQMQVQRAFVLSGFCLAVTALFTSLALVG
jgi:hypothetical protein